MWLDIFKRRWPVILCVCIISQFFNYDTDLIRTSSQVSVAKLSKTSGTQWWQDSRLFVSYARTASCQSTSHMFTA